MENVILWLQATELNSWVVGNRWVWPALETIHFFGLSLLIGALLFIDLRMMGFCKAISIQATHKLLPWAFIGFIMNLVTGVLFVFGEPINYMQHPAFAAKMILVLLAGLNAALYYWKIEPVLADWGPHDDTPMLWKVVGAASLIFWFAVLMLGRLLPYAGGVGG